MLDCNGDGDKSRNCRNEAEALIMVTSAPEETILIEEIDSDIEDLEIDDEDTRYEILVYPADFTLLGLYDKWKAETLRLPDFQRQYVWNKRRASRLIESFLLGLPVPGIFLYTERQTQQQMVIDGQQRLLSVFYYFSGRFSNESEFRLSDNIDSRWRGRAYRDLEKPDRLRLEDSILRATIVRQLHPSDDTSIFHIFERLNTTSTPLSPQEIRNCIYHGPFNDALKSLNQNDEAWRSIMGNTVPSPRQRDVELALRMIALYSAESDYRKPMKDFLNSVMGTYRNLTPNQLLKWQNLFRRTSKVIFDSLGEKPFHVRSGLNAAVFDSVTVAFARNLDRVPADICTRYEQLKSHDEFVRTTTSNTTDVDYVHRRIAVAERVLFGS